MAWQGLLSFLSQPLAIQISLEGEDRRRRYHRTVLPPSPTDLGRHETCPVYRSGDRIAGTVRPRCARPPSPAVR